MTEAEDPKIDNNVAKKFPQYLSSFIGNLSAFGSSASFCPLLMSTRLNDYISIGPEEKQNIHHLYFIGALFGTLISGLINEKLGPKRAIQITAFPLFLSRLVTAYCRTVYGFYAAILLHGFASGITLFSALNYAIDIAETRRRGSVALLFFLMHSLGKICANFIGNNVNDFILQALIPSVVPVIYLTALSFMPESPVFMCTNEDFPQASSSLQWLRGPDYNIDEEISSLRDRTLTKENRNESDTTTPLPASSLRQTAVAIFTAMAVIVSLFYMLCVQQIIESTTLLYVAPTARIFGQVILMLLIDRMDHTKLLKILFTWTAVDTIFEQVFLLTWGSFEDYGLTHLFNELTAHGSLQLAILLLWQIFDVHSRSKMIPLCLLLWNLLPNLMSFNSNVNFHWVYITALVYLFGYMVINYFLLNTLNKTGLPTSTVHAETIKSTNIQLNPSETNNSTL